MLASLHLPLLNQHPKKTLVLEGVHLQPSLRLPPSLSFTHAALSLPGCSVKYLLERKDGGRMDRSREERKEGGRREGKRKGMGEDNAWSFSLDVINALSSMATWMREKNSVM